MTRRRSDPSATRLISLDKARQLLGGHHPIMLGIGEALPGVFDRVAIHAALDRKANLTPELAGPEPANDASEEDELVQLEKRIADAARRA